MTNSYFLGQVMGLYLIIMACYLIVKKQQVVRIKESIEKTPALLVFSGIISLLLGLLVVLSHSIWVFSWPLLITLFGYLMVAVGIVRLFFPEKALKAFHAQHLKYYAVVMLIFGVWLTLAAFQVL